MGCRRVDSGSGVGMVFRGIPSLRLVLCVVWLSDLDAIEILLLVNDLE